MNIVTAVKQIFQKPKAKTKVILARGKYRIVSPDGQRMIEASSVERRKEDEILDPTKRAKLLDLTRNLVRNSSLFNTILGQMTTNVVSTCGGKVVLSLPDEKTSKALKTAFAKYTRNVDFNTADRFNHLLKRILREYVIGGDCVLLFDDGIVEDSGKVLFFESNEIVDVSKEEVERHYGKGCWSSQGKVYSPFGRHIGTIVSRGKAGADGLADPAKCYFLRRDPNSVPTDEYWFHFSNNWREGRGVSQAASAISTIHQLEDLVESELLASRRNSQIFCWLTQPKTEEAATVPSAFDGDTDFENMTDEEVQKAAEEAAASNEQTVSFNHAKENSVVYEALPEGYDAKQLQMTHPNQNVQVMVDWLANRAAASMGLSKVFATGNPTDSDYRANQLFTQPAIVELQKDLEQICDWVFARYVRWAMKKGIVSIAIPEDYLDYVNWEWKGIDDLNPVVRENAIALELKNMTKNYSEILGPSWRERLKQTAFEREWMKENGITPPQDLMLSGGQTEQSKRASK